MIGRNGGKFMNRVFKVIWSHARNAYVVVSEIALNHGKNTKGSTGAVHLKKALIAALLVSGTFGGVLYGGMDSYAADLGNDAAAVYDAHGNLTIGKNVHAEGKNNTGSNNTVIGTDSDTIRDDGTGKGQALDDTSNEKLVDGEGQAHDLNRSTESSGDREQGSTAIGYDSHAEGDASTAIGNKARVLNKPTTYYADAEGNKTTSVDDAAWYADNDGKPTKVPQVFRDADNKTTTTPQYIHTYTEKDATTGQTVTKTEITTDATKADKNADGSLKYNYQKADNLDKLYSVTLYQPSSNSIAAGSEVEADGENAVAVGYQSTAKSSAVAIGDNAKAEKDTVAIGKEANASVEGSVALGLGSTADRAGGVAGWDPKTGTNSQDTTAVWKSGNGAISVGNGEGSRQITNVAAGSEDSDAVNLAQLKKAMIHYYSVKTTEDTDKAGNNNYLNDGATGDNALAAGVRAMATADNATAVGMNTHANGENSSAYGYNATAAQKDSVAIGSGATAQREKAISIGAHAIGTNSIAIGSYQTPYGYANPATSAGENSIAIGGHTGSGSTNSIAIGAGSYTNGGNAVTVGGGATGTYAASLGNSSVAGGTQASAVGYNTAATGEQTTALGANAKAGRNQSVAIGSSTANGNQAVAIGSGAVAASGDYYGSDSGMIAIGQSTAAHGQGTTALGYSSHAGGTNTTAIGGSNSYGLNTIAIGGATSGGSSTIAIGQSATVDGGSSIALGNGSNVYGSGSTGVGAGTKAFDSGTAVGNGVQAGGYQATAIGVGSNATGANATAIGGGGAWAAGSVAIGSGAGTNTNAIAIGKSSGAWGESAVAIGEGTNAWRANSIVIGKNSKSGADKNVQGFDPITGKASKDTSATWNSTDEAVSFGRAEERDEQGNVTKTAITRQLNNVAAGTLDTDAVNVAQLKRVKEAMDSVAGAHTAVTVNDKSNPTAAKVGGGQYGDYAGGEADNLHIAAMKGTDGKLTYNIKLNDQLNIGKKGADGTDGKVTVDTKGGTTVIIGHDGENGKDGKDGLFVRGDDGKDGKSGVSIIGPNGQTGDAGIDGKVGIAGKDGKDAVSISGKDGVGHIGLTGPKGADGKDGTSIDLSTDYRTKTLNPDKNTTVNGEEKASRIVYKDAKGDHEVATMDDGLKFIGDDDTATPIAKKLNETLQIRGDGTYDATTKKVADDGNIKTSVADGAVKVSLSDKINLHQNGSLTLGGDANGTEKDGTDPITIRHFDDKTLDVITGVDKEGKPITSKEGKAGDYITGLDNKTWNNESYVSGRAATEDQLHQAVSNLIGPNANGGFGLSANGSEVKQALGKTITINGDGMYGTDGKETTAGNISTSVEKGAIKVSLNRDLNIDSTTMEKTNDDGSRISNVTNAEGSTITKTDASGKQSSTTINAGSLTIKDGDGTTTIGGGSATIGGVTINGNGEKDGSDQHTSTITGLTNTTFDTNNTKQYEGSGRAATEGQLKEVYDKASQHTTVTVNGNPTTDGNLKLDTTANQDGSKNYAISLNNDITLGDKEKSGKLTVKSQDGTKSITTNGEDGTLTFKDGSNTASMKAAESAKGVDGTTDINRIAIDNHTVATMDDGMQFAGDSGEALKQKLNSTTNIKGGATGDLSDGNIGVVSDGKDTLTVKLAKDIKGLNSVEAATINATTVNSSTFNAGNTTIDNSGVTIKTGDSGRTITIKDGGVSMGGNQIHNVAPGTAPDDAVNVSQLNATNGVVNKLGSRINKVGAGAAALAALHPLDFDPDDKWDVAAGYGHYKNADAAAIGAFYQPNEDTILSIGGSFGGGENMVNAGVSVKLGQGNHVSTSRVAMAKEIRDLRENVAKLNDVVNRQSALIDKLTGVNAGTIQDRGNDLFPDVPANHWAYEYVTALHKAGILEGYPDGTFSGDRMMTRYEFAAIVYRAIMAGAASNPALNRDGTLDKLAKEFSSEMKYIRIDTISKDRNGNPDIQRVRVIPKKQEKK